MSKLIPKLRLDGWMSLLTGLGTSRDKLTSHFFQRGVRLSDEQLESMFDGDDVAARIVETLPDDAMREGFEIAIEPDEESDSTQIEQVQETASNLTNLLDDLQAVPRINEAWVWGRLFGGGVIWIITRDSATPDQELNIETVEQVTSLMVLDKRDLTPHSFFSDPEQSNFGEVEQYRITLVSQNAQAAVSQLPQLIHSSRLLVFEGERTSRRRKSENNGWSHSVLQRPCEVLRNFNVSFGAISHLMVDASQGVFKMEGLIAMLGSGGKDTIRDRMEVVDMGRSVARALVIDAENESFERKETTFVGHADVLEKLMLRLSSAARMPVSKLMGQAPAGMNATGESDRALWEDEVKAQQTRVLKPVLEKLIRILFLSSAGPTSGVEPDRWAITFNALRQMTEGETAELRNKVAQTDVAYINAGVVLPEEIALSRFRADGYSMETAVDLELRKDVLESESEKERQRAEQPDPVPPPAPDPNAPPPEPVPPTEDPNDDPEA